MKISCINFKIRNIIDSNCKTLFIKDFFVMSIYIIYLFFFNFIILYNLCFLSNPLENNLEAATEDNINLWEFGIHRPSLLSLESSQKFKKNRFVSSKNNHKGMEDQGKPSIVVCVCSNPKKKKKKGLKCKLHPLTLVEIHFIF